MFLRRKLTINGVTALLVSAMAASSFAQNAPILPEQCGGPNLVSRTITQDTSLLRFDFLGLCTADQTAVPAHGTSSRVVIMWGEVAGTAKRSLRLPPAGQMVRLREPGAAGLGLVGFKDLDPGFAGLLSQGESRPFLVAYAVPDEHQGPLEAVFPSASEGFAVPIASVTSLPGGDAVPAPEANESTPATPVETPLQEVALKFSTESGLPISRAILGGKVTRVDPPSPGKDPVFSIEASDRLNNGVFSDSAGRYAVDDLSQPVRFVVSFADGGKARVRAVRVGAVTTGSFEYHPAEAAVSVSETGPDGPWREIVPRTAIEEDRGLFVFEFPPVNAAAVRVDLFARPDSEAYRRTWHMGLREIEVVEVPEADGYRSVTASLPINALDPDYGGHVVSFTSQNKSHQRYAAAALGRPKQSFWAPATDETPHSVSFAFQGHDLQTLDEITVTLVAPDGFPDAWQPQVRVEASTDISPTRGYRQLGFLTPSAQQGRLTLALADPTSVRYLRVIVIDPDVPEFGIAEVTARGRLIDWLRSRSVTSRPLSSDGADQSDPEPNDDFATAIKLVAGAWAFGSVGEAGDDDYYQFTVGGEAAQTVNFQLAGTPRLTASLELFDATGALVAATLPSNTSYERVFTWSLAPGTYYIRLYEEPTSVALLIDRSSSMGAAIGDAMDAARAFIASKREREEISVYRFNASIDRLTPYAADRVLLLAPFETWRVESEPASGGTSLYDAILNARSDLAGRPGNQAMVVLSDGADTRSSIGHEGFWPTLPSMEMPLFAIGYGPEMHDFDVTHGATARDTLRAMALAAEGAFFDAPETADLAVVFEEIARRIREPSTYQISYDLAPARGQIEVKNLGSELTSAAAAGEVLIILDASGSMRAKTDEGRQRINVARSVLFDLLESVPEGVPLGLRVYGHSRPSEPKPQSCTDSVLSVPPGTENRRDIISTVAAISPQGQTPIGYSLALAEEDLRGNKALLILLTDGQETCDVDPSAPYYPPVIIDRLLAAGLDLRVNIVGFDVDDPEVQEGLKAIAESTGGQFFAASGQEGLQTAMQQAFVAPVEILDDAGSVVANTRVGDPPIEVSAGSYRVRVSNSEFISEKQAVRPGELTSIGLYQEGAAIRMRVEKHNSGERIEVTPEQVAQTVHLDARPPETQEELVFKVQYFLRKLGYEPGPLDGGMGSRTRQAVEQFLADSGPPPADQPAFDAAGQPTLFLWFHLFSTHLHQGAPM